MMANIESHSLNIWGCVLYIETQVSGTGIILKRGELSLTIQRHCIYQTSVLNGNEMKQNEFSPIFRDDSLGDGTWWLLNSIQQNKSVPPSSSFMNGEQFHQSQQSFSLCIKKQRVKIHFCICIELVDFDLRQRFTRFKTRHLYCDSLPFHSAISRNEPERCNVTNSLGIASLMQLSLLWSKDLSCRLVIQWALGHVSSTNEASFVPAWPTLGNERRNNEKLQVAAPLPISVWRAMVYFLLMQCWVLSSPAILPSCQVSHTMYSL